MNHAQRPTVAEAIRIGKVSMEFVDAYDFIAEMRDAFQCRPINQDASWNLICMMFDCYNAGRMYGIRQERARRKGRQTAQAGQERS